MTSIDLSCPKATLIELGFEPAGNWRLVNEHLHLHLERHQKEKDFLYAFVEEDQVLYIGKSTRTLAQRMYGYLKPGVSQRTNLTNHANLLARLIESAEIEIYVFLATETLTYRGWTISLAAGLEDTLIARLQPQWNKTGLRG